MKKEEDGIKRVMGPIQKICTTLSIIQWISIAIVSFGSMVGVIILLMNNPFFGILFGILLAIAGFAIIAIFVNRKEEKRREEEKKRMLEDLEKELNIKAAGMRKATTSRDQLPIVEFKIAVEKKMNLKLEPQKILLDLICDIIPQKTFFWNRSYNIEDIKENPDIEAPDIEATGNGNIRIRCPCMNVYYFNHNYIHVWKLKGKVTFRSKIEDITRDITREIKLTFQLDKEEEEELKNDIKNFQKFYVEGGYKPVS